jgi:hypothetical protein
MIKDVWINLPVKDLAKSVLFYEMVKRLHDGLKVPYESLPTEVS